MLKYISLLLYAIACISNADAQNFTITPIKMNILYVGVPNPMKVVVEDRGADDILVVMPGGDIKPNDRPGSYLAYANTPGMYFIYILSKNGDTIGKERFRVRPIPSPEIMVGGKSRGTIKKDILFAQIGVTASLIGFDYDVRAKVVEYTLIIMRGNKTIFSKHFTDGPKFNDEVRNNLKKTEVNDKVIFCFVNYTMPNKQIHQGNAVELTITE